MSSASIKESATISARLDRIPAPSRTHWIILGLMAALGVFDAFDLLIFGYTAPAVRANLQLPIEAVGYIGSAAFIGSFVGAIAGGLLADRFGRRPILVIGTVVYSLGSGLAALAANMEMLIAARAVTGLGAQAVIIVSMIYIVEMFPAKMRGRFVALYLGIVAPAGVLAALVSLLIVPMGPEHWRVVYSIGACGIIVAFLAWMKLPESVRWQAQHGQYAAAAKTLDVMERDTLAKSGKALPELVYQPHVGTSKPTIRELLAQGNVKRLVVLSVAMIFFAMVFYGFNTWLTTLLVERGYTQKEALTAAVAITLANVIASFFFAPFADRIERKTTVFFAGTAVAALMLLFGLFNNLLSTLISGFLLSGILQIVATTLFTYSAEIFPLHLRGLGAGIGGAASRLSAAFGSVIIGLVLTGLGFSAVFVFFSAVAMLLAIGFLLFGERTKGRRLEDITADGGRALDGHPLRAHSPAIGDRGGA